MKSLHAIFLSHTIIVLGDIHKGHLHDEGWQNVDKSGQREVQYMRTFAMQHHQQTSKAGRIVLQSCVSQSESKQKGTGVNEASLCGCPSWTRPFNKLHSRNTGKKLFYLKSLV